MKRSKTLPFTTSVVVQNNYRIFIGKCTYTVKTICSFDKNDLDAMLLKDAKQIANSILAKPPLLFQNSGDMCNVIRSMNIKLGQLAILPYSEDIFYFLITLDQILNLLSKCILLLLAEFLLLSIVYLLNLAMIRTEKVIHLDV